jgi:hypothetical protein
LRYDLRFDLRFCVCIGVTTQGNAFPARFKGRRLSCALAATTQGEALPLTKIQIALTDTITHPLLLVRRLVKKVADRQRILLRWPDNAVTESQVE